VELPGEVVGAGQAMTEAAGALEPLVGMSDQAQPLVLDWRLTHDSRERRAVSSNTPDKTLR
jgi:hypothetical protein